MPVSDKNIKALKVFHLIKSQVAGFKVPSVTMFSLSKNPYKVLISCILSLRTKDKTTIEASKRLFNLATSAQDMIKLPAKRIAGVIYPVGFYRNKARAIIDLSNKIRDNFNGNVPCRMEDLLSLKGVGRKTANLVLGLGFNIPAICVDTHVHRITNRLGWVKTKTPEQTEIKLMKVFPESTWIDLNTVLVAFGQNICVPVSPFCSNCSVGKFCKKSGVTRSRLRERTR